jgi:hypothetical protein
MYKHAKNLEFEQAAKIRDEIKVLEGLMLGLGAMCFSAHLLPSFYPPDSKSYRLLPVWDGSYRKPPEGLILIW